MSYTYRGKRIQRDRPEEYGPEINSQVEVHPRDVPTGIRIEVQPAGKLGPVIRNDQPWEFFTPYVTLIHHEGKYLLFYNTTTYRLGRSSEGYMVCYAESEDGLNYRKPPLGQVEFQGSRENNLVLGPGVCRYGIHGPAIFVDPKRRAGRAVQGHLPGRRRPGDGRAAAGRPSRVGDSGIA